MPNYNFTDSLSPVDFELLCKDLLEAELNISFENFSEGRDGGIDLRFAPRNSSNPKGSRASKDIIVQCKRYNDFKTLFQNLKNSELEKIKKLNPARYILTTSASLTPKNTEKILELLSPYVQSTADIYGNESLNALISKHGHVERRHIKLWMSSTTILEHIIHASTHNISEFEIEEALNTKRLFVTSKAFGEALEILKREHVCIISGIPGIGKTSLARMLLIHYLAKGHNVVKISEDIKEGLSQVTQKPTFYYYDDFLGQTTSAELLGKNEDQRLIDFISRIRRSKSDVFVLTTREYLLNQARKQYERISREDFRENSCILDLAKYSRSNRALILYNHLYFSEIEKEYKIDVLKENGFLKIIDHPNYSPRVIESMTCAKRLADVSPRNFLRFFLEALDNPMEIWDHVYKYKLSQEARDLLIVLTTLPNSIDVEVLEVALMKFSKNSPSESLQSTLKELEGSFTRTGRSLLGRFVSFSNPSIRDFMQHEILSKQSIINLMSSFAYFEQAQWLSIIIEKREVTLKDRDLSLIKNDIIMTLMLLIDAPECNSTSSGKYEANTRFCARVGFIAETVAKFAVHGKDDWLKAQFDKITKIIKSGYIRVEALLKTMSTLNTCKLLDNHLGQNLLKDVKSLITESPEVLQQYEEIITMREYFPDLFTQDDHEDICDSFQNFLDTNADQWEFDSPGDCYYTISKLEKVGNILEVNTNETINRLNEIADELEKEREKNAWRENIGDFLKSRPSECTDQYIISIFTQLLDDD